MKEMNQFLVIEDNEGDFLLIEDYLKEEIPFAVVSRAKTFSEAKEYLGGENTFKAVLLDLSLPDAQGKKLVNETVRLAEPSPVIVLTGYKDKDFGVETLSEGISDYLLKGDFNASQLHKSIAYSVERKRIGIQLKESEKKYKSLFHLSPIPMWVFDTNTYCFLDINEAAIRQYGYSRAEFLAMTVMHIRPAEDIPFIEQKIQTNKRTGYHFEGTVKHLKKNGELILVSIQGNDIDFDGKDARIILATDVSEMIKAEEALKKQDQEITKAIIKAQERERFQIEGELHDNVNQILATAQLYLQMIKTFSDDRVEAWTEKARTYIGSAIEEIRRISHSLAPASFIESSLKDAFDTLLRTINVDNRYKITCTYEKFNEVSEVSSDIQLNLFRILQEQLKNITRYAEATRIDISLNMDKNKITMRIYDNGKGFDTEVVKRGIGLSNIKKRTELFQGIFKLNSAVGKGCEIIIEIPQQL